MHHFDACDVRKGDVQCIASMRLEMKGDFGGSRLSKGRFNGGLGSLRAPPRVARSSPGGAPGGSSLDHGGGSADSFAITTLARETRPLYKAVCCIRIAPIAPIASTHVGRVPGSASQIRNLSRKRLAASPPPPLWSGDELFVIWRRHGKLGTR